MDTALVVAQIVGALSLVVGVWLALPPAGALAVTGAVLLILATLGEVALRRQRVYGPDEEGP